VDLLLHIGVVLGAYLTGTIPFGLLLTRVLVHKDVRQVGSGNIGATNVARAAGKKIGVLTLVLDAAKGAVPTWIAGALFGPSWWLGAAGLAAVLGHVFPVWLGFRGGKGVATALGVMLATLPGVAVVGLMVYAGIYLVFRISSLGSLVAALTCTLLAVVRAPHPAIAVMVAAIVALIVVRHRGNIRRLLHRQEGKV
jgi:glycerol-3-phosphate acyltransferase PlsY